MDYYDLPQISSTFLRDFYDDPLRAWEKSPFNADRTPEKPTPQMAIGTLAHAIFLEPSTVAGRYMITPLASRRSKAWEEFAAGAAAQGKIPVTVDEYDTATAMASYLATRPDVMARMDGARTEHAITDLHIPYMPDDFPPGKVKFDAVRICDGGAEIIDYKTTSDVAAIIHGQGIYYHRWWIQAAWYVHMLSVAMDMDIDSIRFSFLVQSSTPGDHRRYAFCGLSAAYIRQGMCDIAAMLDDIRCGGWINPTQDMLSSHYAQGEIMMDPPSWRHNAGDGPWRKMIAPARTEDQI